MNQSTDKPSTCDVTQAQIADLAAVEIIEACKCESYFLLSRQYCDACSYSDLTNDGTEVFIHSSVCICTVVRFSWARVECRPFIPPCPHEENDCPLYRIATLEEIDLEAVLVALVKPNDTFGAWLSFKYRDKQWALNGGCDIPHTKWFDTPKAAAIAAVHAALKAETSG